MSYSFILDVATAGILEQPTFSHLEGVENLPQHQEDTKATATTWRNDLRSALFSTNDAILAFNTKFDSFYDPLYTFAEKIDHDPQSRINLALGLIELQNEIKTQQDRVNQAGKKLNDFYTDMSKNMANINGDFITLNAVYQGDTGKLTDLHKKVDSLDKAMSSDLTTIGLGSGAIAVGGLAIAVGVALWIETGGVSTPLIVAGIVAVAGVGGGATAVGIGVKNYNASVDDMSNTIIEINKLSSEIAVITLLNSQVEPLTTFISDANKACDNLSRAWSHLERDYDTLITTLNSTDPGKLSFIVKASLRTAKAQWNSLATDATNIKNNLLTPPKIDNNKLQNPSSASIVTSRQVRSMALRVTPVTPFSATPTSFTVFDKTSDIKSWIDETARKLLQFEEALDSSIVAGGAPADVVTANQQLNDNSVSASEASNAFLLSIEDLSKLAPMLRATALLADDDIVNSAVNVLKDLNNQLSVAKANGTTALSRMNAVESSVLESKSAINGWLLMLQAQEDTGRQQLAEFGKLRDEAAAEKENSKNDYWWCILGIVACVIVAIEQSQKVQSANEKIDLLNDQIKKTSISLSLVISTWQSVNGSGMLF